MFDVTETGKRIKAIRGNVKQSECAEMLGISRAALSQYENGKRKIETDILYKFCELFGVSADYITGLSPNPTVNEDLQAGMKYTGLSQPAIESLKVVQSFHGKRITEPLNELLINTAFYDLLLTLMSLQNESEQFIKTETKERIDIDDKCDMLRYRASRITENIYNSFDWRESNEHNGKQK